MKAVQTHNMTRLAGVDVQGSLIPWSPHCWRGGTGSAGVKNERPWGRLGEEGLDRGYREQKLADWWWEVWKEGMGCVTGRQRSLRGAGFSTGGGKMQAESPSDLSQQVTGSRSIGRELLGMNSSHSRGK